MKKILFSLCVGGVVLGGLPASAEVSLPQIFTSNMVLQRDVPIPVWGWADPGEKVTVTLADQSATVTADEKGNWKVSFPKRGLGKAFTLTVKGENEIKLENLLMGDVWLCSGQSNMEMGVKQTGKFSKQIEKADSPTLRLFYVTNPNRVKAWKKDVSQSATPRKDFLESSGWKVCSPETLKNTGLWGGFSATAYFFGKSLQEQLKEVPIGLVASSSGGSKIEPWTTDAGWKSVPELAKEYQKMKSIDLSKAKASIHSPWPSLYNVSIHPIAQMPIKGVIWYQGEANRRDGMLYFHRMKALIHGWRQHWGENMPFYFVQLAPFSYSKDQAEWLPGIWLAQSEADQKIKNVGMAVTIDIGNPKDIHPKNKPEVGRRLALLALKDTYGKKVLAYSPTAVSSQAKKGSITITFKDVGGGLVSPKEALPGFEVAGKDGVFKPAEAKIVGADTVSVFSKEVPAPIHVRYAWSNTPKVTLKSKEGLPVPCFKLSVGR